MDIIFKDFTECDNDLVFDILKWRNSEIVRKYSFNSNTISLEEHLKFINNLKSNKHHKYYVLQYDNHNIGVIHYKIQEDNKTAYLGYYKNPFLNSIRGGVGKILLSNSLQYAKDVLHLSKIIMETMVENVISQKCIIGQNFKQIEINNNIIKYELILK